MDADRVLREAYAYDQGLRRQRYESVLSHTEYQYRQHRIDLVRSIIDRNTVNVALELGCKAWLDFLGGVAMPPYEVHCTNTCETELYAAMDLARQNGFYPMYSLMDAHDLKYPDHYFDLVFGTGVLHHLQLDVALAEILRVLKPGGLFLFAEPLDNNPLARLVRKLTPATRTQGERALRSADLARIGERLDCTFHYESLLSVPVGLVSRAIMQKPDNPLTRSAFHTDEFLRSRLPRLAPYFRKVLIEGRAR